MRSRFFQAGVNFRGVRLGLAPGAKGVVAVRGWLAWRPGWSRRLSSRARNRLIDRLAGPADEMMQLLLEEAALGVLVVDRAGRVVRANAALLRLLGSPDVDPPTELRSGQPADLIFAAGVREAAWDEIGPVLQGRLQAAGPRPFATTLHGPRAANVSIGVTPLRERNGEVSGALLRIADISQVKQLEAQLALSQKLQAVGQLAGGIAHDFNNLLTAIAGCAESIEERDGVDPDTLEDAQQVRAAAARGGALVRQLLAFGRQQTLQPQVLAINDVVTGVARILGRLLGGKISVVLDLEQPGRLVRADPTQLDQVLVNLAVNARDAMPDGGTLTFRSGHVTLYRPLARGPEMIPPGRYVMIEVQDTGGGIPADVLPRIFDPFFTTKRDQGGHGLGLSTVHGIVRQSDGFLAVDSEPGRGTRLRVYLPRWDGADAVAIPRLPSEDAPRMPAPVAEAGPAVHGRRGAVLLVEDEEPVRRLAARVLTRAGWNVLSAECGETAMRLLDERFGDSVSDPLLAIVTDVVMPGLDGPSLVRAVRNRIGNPQLPAILVSGYAEETLRKDLDAVATSFLPKPYALTDLAAKLDAVVAQLQVGAEVY